MKQYSKSYHVFLPSSQPIALLTFYILYPLGVLCFTYFLRCLTMFSFICFGATGAMLIIVEGLFDYIAFAGIQSRKDNNLEYIKTSAKGKQIICQGMKMAAWKRILTIGVVVSISLFISNIGATKKEEVPYYMIFRIIILVCLTVQAASCITRYFSNIYLCIGVNYVLLTLYSIVGFATWNMHYDVWVYIILIGVLVGLLVLNQKLSMKGVEASYYDQSN
ncbi:hypothetical protein [Anaerosporobacter faecicola]|uniref:hypothetical protein n=1 Tax=Anaerosporobacter faecicola TaxID=2718714 RepID=UPI001439D2CB|nr:hypothetical protein [Anaerosporobacter faecicola]